MQNTAIIAWGLLALGSFCGAVQGQSTFDERSLLPTPEVRELLVPLDWQHEGIGYGYQIYEPAPKNSSEKYPLIVWLHDHNTGGPEPPQKHLGRFFGSAVREDHPFYLLAMQCPAKSTAWSVSSQAALLALIDRLVADFAVDPERICLVGLGTGGVACWEVVEQHSDQFAAAAPLAATSVSLVDPGALGDLPVWAFSPADGASTAAKAIGRLKQAGGIAACTEVEGNGSEWLTSVIGPSGYDLRSWLLSQKRGESSWNRPGRRPWRIGELAAQTIVPMAIFLALALEWRRRQNQAGQAPPSPQK